MSRTGSLPPLLVAALVLTGLHHVHGQAQASNSTAESGDPYVEGRVVVPMNLGDGRIFNLRLPRFLPATSEGGGFRRTFEDTCGLYDIAHLTKAPKGMGPQPHLHYSDDEWFIIAGSGQRRMFSAQQPHKPYIPGELPGYNVPAAEMGSAVLGPREVLYSPKGNVHYYVVEEDAVDLFDIHASGFAAPLVIGGSFNISDPQELLYFTALYGAPTDVTGQMVGLEDYRSARGPVARFDPELLRLQALFDAGEACYPALD